MKAFLSHSSKQKDYVEQVASILGKDKVNYDSWSFDAGGKTLDEIYTGIENSGVFVFFISLRALGTYSGVTIIVYLASYFSLCCPSLPSFIFPNFFLVDFPSTTKIILSSK